MKPNRKRLIFSNNKDPFTNMIIRPHKSPQLQPVIIDSRKCLKISRSAGSLRDRIILPPLISTQNRGESGGFDRNKLQTPDFNTNNFFVREKIRKKAEISFGDVDENTDGLNDIMKKYHF